jgi:hypothetical protein
LGRWRAEGQGLRSRIVAETEAMPGSLSLFWGVAGGVGLEGEGTF